MKRLVLIAALIATPAAAQEEDGFSLIEEGAKLFLRGLMTEMEPAIDDFRGFVEELGPAMEDFAEQMGPLLAQMLNRVDDLRHYSQPEFLPNGDIIIRRKPDAPAFEPPPMEDLTESIEL